MPGIKEITAQDMVYGYMAYHVIPIAAPHKIVEAVW